MCGYTYAEVNYASEISCECATPHKAQDYHDEHPAGRVGNVPKWIFTRVKNILVGVVDPKSNFLHLKFSK